ncbi:MAG: ATP-binding protein, partial [Pseudonocardia sediminis]
MDSPATARAAALPPDLRVRLPGSEMDALMAACDWASGPLGPPEQWPADLRATAGLCLNSRFPMLLMWGPDLTMIYNDAYAPMLGDKHPAALGEPLTEVWSEVWPVIADMVDAVAERGEVVYHENLQLMMRRNGFEEEAYFTFCYHPVLRADGTVGGVVDTVTETTAQVLAARRLAALQDLARIPAARIGGARPVCDSVADVLALFRADLPFGAIYLRDEAGGATLAASFGDEREALPSYLAADIDTLAGPDAVVLPLGASGPDPIGTVVLGVSPHLLLDDAYRSFLDLVAGQVASAISDAEAYEAQRRRMQQMADLERARTDFFTGVSHELRTPLALIAGPAADSLADTGEPLTPAHRQRLELVHRNTGRLSRLVDTLLDFARIEDGGLTPDLAVVDPGELTRDVAGSFAPAVHRAGLGLVVDSPDVGAVRLDPDMWEKIVLNLLSNAVKFTVAGGVTVRLTRTDGVLELRVDDSGIGIPADELPHLFRRFHRVRGTAGRSAEGSGIGLALVSELAALHGGAADVTSEPGEGSTFTVRVPVDAVVAPARTARPRSVG